jgi:hypothetical protein
LFPSLFLLLWEHVFVLSAYLATTTTAYQVQAAA